MLETYTHLRAICFLLNHNMVHIPPFQVTAWVDENAHSVKHDLAGSVCAPLSIKDLIELSRQSDEPRRALDFNLIDLDYNSPMQGGYQLRDNLAALYSDRVTGSADPL